MGHIGNHDTQSITQGDTQDDTQDGTKGVPQENGLDDWIENHIRSNPQISTADLAELRQSKKRIS